MFRPIAIAATLLAATAATPAFANDAPLPVGTCINMGNSLEPETENGWGGKRIAADDFARIKAAGFETIRLPVRWHNKSAETPPYTIDAAWLDRVTELVDMALAAELNVILNSHHFDPIYDDPKGVRDWHAGVWTQIAARFADRPTETLWFEIENEPHNKLTNDNLIETLQPSLNAIRASNPTRAVIIGGEDWSSIDSLATLELPEDDNIHSTFHYYAPFDFTHQGASWTGDAMPPIGREYGTAADAKILQDDVAKLKAYIDRTGKTPFMGETGAYDAHIPLDQRIQYHKAVTDAFGPTQIGICMWAYTNTFPFFDQASGQWIPGMRAAIGLPDDAAVRSTASNEGETATAARPLNNPNLPDELKGIDDALLGALINDPRRLDWDTYGSNFTAKGYADDSIPGGQAALKFTIKQAGETHSVGATIPLLDSIKTGDVVTLGFFARTLESNADDGKGRVQVRFQQNSEPYPGFGDTLVSPDGDWGWYEVSGTANRDISAKLATIGLQVGSAVQTIEIGQAIAVKGTSSIVD